MLSPYLTLNLFLFSELLYFALAFHGLCRLSPITCHAIATTRAETLQPRLYNCVDGAQNALFVPSTTGLCPPPSREKEPYSVSCSCLKEKNYCIFGIVGHFLHYMCSLIVYPLHLILISINLLSATHLVITPKTYSQSLHYDTSNIIDAAGQHVDDHCHLSPELYLQAG